MVRSRLQPARKSLSSLLLSHAQAFAPHRGLTALLAELLGMWGVRPRVEPARELAPVVPELVETYARAVAQEEPFADVLGSVYMELASHGQKQWLGQFFSPATLCDLNAQLLIGALSQGRLTTICDPACGSGAMLLAACRHVLRSYDVPGLLRISVTGIDLDAVCADMAAVQLLANCNTHDVQLGEIRILRGDALGDPTALSLVVHAKARSEAPATVASVTLNEETADAV
jgi:type I restriction-modification system DNA methylase subunit